MNRIDDIPLWEVERGQLLLGPTQTPPSILHGFCQFSFQVFMFLTLSKYNLHPLTLSKNYFGLLCLKLVIDSLYSRNSVQKSFQSFEFEIYRFLKQFEVGHFNLVTSPKNHSNYQLIRLKLFLGKINNFKLKRLK